MSQPCPCHREGRVWARESVSLGAGGCKSTMAHCCPCIAPHPSSSEAGAVEGQGGFLWGCSWALWGCGALHGAGSVPVGHGTRGVCQAVCGAAPRAVGKGPHREGGQLCLPGIPHAHAFLNSVLPGFQPRGGG